MAFDKSALDEVAMKLYRERHRTIAKCTEDFDRGQFNTAISAVMELVNAASAYLNATEGTARDKALCYGVAKDIVSVLAPICPFWADELWHEALGCEATPYHRRLARVPTWPSPSRTRCRSSYRFSARSAAASTWPAMPPMRICSCRRGPPSPKWLEGKTVVKAICVPGKLVNLVVK